ncbi:iron compound ABC transporter substrate-binding protein [Pseudomonas saudimassiliensis]|uniref:Iron compound ABC transporter substrate-binding protein n=1 Tax=Pseudomonas saudimassiliensis TaxID=1461581 RepID=A0A078MAC9_9PSED|nr:siderophore ABC transporter substrate-binding protein [Pseudomonas saudimassiliensis]CEA04363.1 iron compound ABC transporter substrate-binding protein [Pseudomonas saudimassiliensis]CEF26559.1 iron compound ABC transporter substrate-binding protein [Pseudomonas saudimassiliensis]
MRFLAFAALPLSLALSVLMTFSAAHAAYPLTIEQPQGSVPLEQVPTRVAVFDLAMLDTLAALGVEVAGVPAQVGPAHLQAFQDDRYARVGTLFEPDYAALKALQPDLIIIAGRSRAAYAQLAEVAPTLDLTLSPDAFVDGMRANLQQLGTIFEKQQEAQQLEAELQQALHDVQQKTRGLSSVTLFTINGRVMTHAPGERFGMLYELLGTQSTAEAGEAAPRGQARPEAGSAQALKLQQAQRTRLDQALAQQPDWLVVLDRGAATGGEGQAAETLGQDAAIAATQAWQQGKVYYLDPAAWYTATGGYQSVMKTLQEFGGKL